MRYAWVRRRRVTLLGTIVASLLLPSSATAAGRGGLGDPYFPDDGNSGYNVDHYDVRVDYDPARPGHLDGDTTVTARATERLDTFHLDLKGFTVTSVTVNGEAAQRVTREGAHELVITPAEPVAEGTKFQTQVRYTGEPDKEGWRTLKNGGASALGEPHSATSWFPSNDHPSDKATFQLTSTVPDGWTAIGNGLPGKTTAKNGMKTFRWYEDQPMATYLATVAIDKFTVRYGHLADGTPVITAWPPDFTPDAATEAEQIEIIDYLASIFGPYPFSSAGAIMVGELEGEGLVGALETQSRPTYSGGPIFDGSVSHENAHQWFGDSVSFTDWRDGCIAECVAQYTTQLWEEHKYGSDLDKGFYAPEVERNKDDPEFWSTMLYDPGQGKELDNALYSKGSLMMHALRRTVGDQDFFATLKRWTHDHAYGNASWPRFEKLVAEVSGKDLTGFFDAWVRGTTRPADPYLYPGSLSPSGK
ncbi:M1 family metallopeptidase [Streptomyces sp. NPDC004250]|uniref:M1 family metallopeptidase n=1 Tax=Streptomyces sp. NPDC004250 TaxID=3364692 RepID=UPI0036987055